MDLAYISRCISSNSSFHICVHSPNLSWCVMALGFYMFCNIPMKLSLPTTTRTLSWKNVHLINPSSTVRSLKEPPLVPLFHPPVGLVSPCLALAPLLLSHAAFRALLTLHYARSKCFPRPGSSLREGFMAGALSFKFSLSDMRSPVQS